MPIATTKFRIDRKKKKIILESHGDVVYNGSTKMGEISISYKKLWKKFC